jgi:hypothetical protein
MFTEVFGPLVGVRLPKHPRCSHFSDALHSAPAGPTLADLIDLTAIGLKAAQENVAVVVLPLPEHQHPVAWDREAV